MGTLGHTGWDAAADGDDRSGSHRLGNRGHDVAPLAGGEGMSRFVDHGRPPVRLDDHGRAAEFTADGYRSDVHALGPEHLDGDAAEPARERAHEMRRRPECQRRPADVDRFAPRGDGGLGRPQHLAGDERSEPDRAVDRLVEADHQHRRHLPLLSATALDIDVRL